MCYPISMKKFYLLFIFSLLSVVCFAQKDLFDLKSAQSSVYAKYIGGKEILNKNSAWRLNVASVVKLFTTAAALDALGPEHTFSTEIYYDGKIKGNTLKGDIYIVGGGDPTLASKYFDKSLEDITSSWVRALEVQGIKKIEGNIYGDNTLFKDNTLPVYTTYQNIGNYFAAPAEALTIKDNSFTLYFEPSLVEGSLGKIAKIEPQEISVPIEVKATHTNKVSKEDSYLNYIPLENKMVISGFLPLSDDRVEVFGAMANPALFTVQYFKQKLTENGIKVKGKTLLGSKESYNQDNLICAQSSVPLKEIIQRINKKSINLYADILLRHLGKGEAKAGTLAIKKYLDKIGVDSSSTTLYDGSGLARANLTTCKTIVSLLEQVSKQPYGQDFSDSLSLVGSSLDSGNMSKRMKNTLAAGKAKIKTGSIEGVRAHAGYITDKDGRQIAFCIASNNFEISKAEIDSLHEEIILSLASLDRKSLKPSKHATKK